MKRSGRDDEKLSWRELAHLYRTIRIPWAMLILVGAFSIVVKQVQVWVVPYTSQIMTGAITEHGFLGGFVAMTLLYDLVEAVQGGLNELTGQMTVRNVRHTVWGKILRLPLSDYGGRDTQSLVSRVTQDTNGTYAALAALIQLVSVLYGTWVAFHRMYITYHALALIMLSGIPITLLSAWIVGKMQYKISYITNTAISRMTNFFAERLPNVLRIKTARMEDEEYRRGVQANEERYRAEIRQERLFILMAPIGSLAQYINEIVLLVVASAMVRAGTMQMFQMVNLYNYYLLFMSNAFMISAVWQSFKTSHGASTTIARLARAADEDLESGEPVGEEPGDITAEQVTFSYDGTRNALSGASFTIPAGQITAIVGENGCGKSTLIKLLERFYREQEGSLRLGGRALEEVNLQDWRESVGYLFQGNQIIQGTIRENIAYGVHRSFTEEELIDAAKQARAYDFILGKENGFDTQISRFDNKCSGGEMQRIAIARILLKRPRILIMDEATSGIDVVSEAEVMEALMNLMAGRTVIMVSHDMNMIRRADNVVVLNGGRVEASGSYDQVLRESPLLRKFEEMAGEPTPAQ
ncbi:MAG: ABC transporter ATP-binding protein [Oscillospiraceae bacterium]|nr:ABC transporter ATP-binding protein [Oscillospiraceae bacterium]